MSGAIKYGIKYGPVLNYGKKHHPDWMYEVGGVRTLEVSYMDDAPAFCGCLCQPCDGQDEDEEPCPCRGTGHGIQA